MLIMEHVLFRYYNHFNDAKAPRTPNFNVQSSDKHPMVAENPILNETAVEWIDQLYRDRLRTLLSVDDIIKELFEYLEDENLLNNTYVLFTSDHGYHLGQWRIACSKQQMYDTDIRVPMYIRGPGITAQSTADEMVVNIDILPTFVDLAGIVLDDASVIDGKSLVGAIIPEFEQDTSILIENQLRNSKNVQNRKTQTQIIQTANAAMSKDNNITNIHNNNNKIEQKQKQKDLLKMREILRVNSTDDWREMMITQYHTGADLTFFHCTVWWVNDTIPMEIDNNGNMKEIHQTVMQKVLNGKLIQKVVIIGVQLEY